MAVIAHGYLPFFSFLVGHVDMGQRTHHNRLVGLLAELKVVGGGRSEVGGAAKRVPRLGVLLQRPEMPVALLQPQEGDASRLHLL